MELSKVSEVLFGSWRIIKDIWVDFLFLSLGMLVALEECQNSNRFRGY